MTKARLLAAALFLGALVSFALPAAAAPVSSGYVAVSGGSAVGVGPRQGTGDITAAQQTTAPPGPRIDPAETDRANASQTRSKIIVGGIAVVLLLIVLYGRQVRSKKTKKKKDQAKGK